MEYRGLRTGRRVAAGLAAAMLLWTLPALRAIAQEADATLRPTFRSDVDLTRVSVAVLDGDGHPIPGLGTRDFRVLENGRALPVRVVLAPDTTALDVGVVLDFSGSIAADWPEARAAAQEFLASLSPRDCVLLMPFNDEVGPGVWAEAGSERLSEAVEAYPLDGGTRLYDALRAARDAMLDRELRRMDPDLPGARPGEATGACGSESVDDLRRRKALVVITDGADSGSLTPWADALVDAARSEVPVLSVAVGFGATDTDTLRWARARRSFSGRVQAQREAAEIEGLQDQLREIARVTGGRFFMQPQLRSGYAEILAALRGLYVVAVEGGGDTGWSDLDIRVPGAARVVVQDRVYRIDADARRSLLELRRGRLLAAAGDLAGAADAFATADGLDPDGFVAPLYRAFALEQLERWSEARDAYRDVISRVPGAAVAHAGLARTAARLGDIDEAWDHYVDARLAGADIGDAANLLRGSEEPPDLDARLVAPIVCVLAPTIADLDAILASRGVRRRLDAAIVASPEIGYTTDTSVADLTLHVVIDRYEPSPKDGGRLRIDLVLENIVGMIVDDHRLEVRNLEDDEEIERQVAAAVRWLVQAVSAGG